MNRVLLAGPARAPALVLGEPLSMWGGLDPETGLIIDRRHPQHGQSVTDRILVLPAGRGSSSAASVLAEAIRLETAPRAILLAAADDIILLGALVAEELYSTTCPIVVIDDATYRAISSGDEIVLGADGTVTTG